MTNYEMLKNGNGGASPAKLAEIARAFFEKRMDVVRRNFKTANKDFCEWMFSPADTAVVFDIGDLVEYTDKSGNKVYGIVREHKYESYSPIEEMSLETAYGHYTVHAERNSVRKSELPRAIIEIARRQLIESCPLLGKGCDD